MHGALRRDGKMPGPCVATWGCLELGDVLETNIDETKVRIRNAMTLVKLTVNPCEVDDSGKILVFQADNDSTLLLSCEDFEGGIGFQDFQEPPVDTVEETLDSGSNTIAFSDYKDVAGRLAGRTAVVRANLLLLFLVATLAPSIALTAFPFVSLQPHQHTQHTNTPTPPPNPLSHFQGVVERCPYTRDRVLVDLEALHSKCLSEAAEAGQLQTQEGASSSGVIKLNTKTKMPRGGKW